MTPIRTTAPAAVTYLDPLDDPNLYRHGRKLAREGKCGRGCCWTPFQVCAWKRRCKCHHAVKEAVIRDIFDEDGNLVEEFEPIMAAAA